MGMATTSRTTATMEMTRSIRGQRKCPTTGWTTTAMTTPRTMISMAMEPMGHIAGMAASIAGSVSTVISVLIAVPVGLAFNGTPLPLAIGSVLCCAAGCLVMRAVARLERVAVSH